MQLLSSQQLHKQVSIYSAMKLLLLIIINFISLSSQQEPTKDWYRTASFYQIYPQTFYDGGGGNREGFGTLKGIMDKLDYISSLNVDCIWLTPIFKTSYNAFGYDIIDYEDVDGRFGTKDDFRKLIDAVHAKGMKIIVDFVPNHCGYEHEFFQKSAANDSEYRDWFIWGNGRNNNQDPPSNWQRIGDGPGSAWSRTIEGREIMTRNEWFMSQFYWNMPDFNLRHPEVKKYWQKFLRYWLNFKLDGFRIDAISHGFEVLPNADGTFPDEAVNPDVSNPKDFGYLHHNLTQDLPELFDLVYDWRDILDEFNDTQR
jgi:alpha-glucosidase